MIDLLEWVDVPGQGVKSNGQQNAQLELTRTKKRVSVALLKLKEQSEKFREHLCEKRWRSHMKKLDTAMFNANATRALLTNFAAALCLRAQDTDNCSADKHAVMCVFFVLCD